MRLAMRNVIGGNHFAGKRKPRSLNSHFCQSSRAGGNDRPAVFRQALQQFERSRQRNDTLDIFNLTALHFAILQLMISVREIFPNRGKAGTAVGTGDDLLRVESAFYSPTPP